MGHQGSAGRSRSSRIGTRQFKRLPGHSREHAMKWMPSILLALSAFLPTPAAALQAERPVGLRMIVVQTESQATGILARLQAGEKFDQLARTQSVDSTARDG